MRGERALLDQRSMIAKERGRRHPLCQSPSTLAPHRGSVAARRPQRLAQDPRSRRSASRSLGRDASSRSSLPPDFHARRERRRRQPVGIGECRHPRSPLRLPGGIGSEKRDERRARGFREHEGGLRHALRRKPSAGVVGARHWRRKSAAARHDRGGKSCRLIGHEDQKGTGRGLLERLQQRVGRSRVHALGRRDDGDLRTLAVARELDEVDQRAYAFDRDRLGGRQFAALFVDRCRARAAADPDAGRRSRTGNPGRRRIRGRRGVEFRRAAPARD